MFGDKKVNETLDNIGSWTLSRDGPRHHQHSSLLHLPPILVHNLVVSGGAGDGHHVQPALLDALTQALPGHDVPMVGHQLVQVCLAPGVGVWVAQSKLVSLLVRVESKGK